MVQKVQNYIFQQTVSVGHMSLPVLTILLIELSWHQNDEEVDKMKEVILPHLYNTCESKLVLRRGCTCSIGGYIHNRPSDRKSCIQDDPSPKRSRMRTNLQLKHNSHLKPVIVNLPGRLALRQHVPHNLSKMEINFGSRGWKCKMETCSISVVTFAVNTIFPTMSFTWISCVDLQNYCKNAPRCLVDTPPPAFLPRQIQDWLQSRKMGTSDEPLEPFR